MRNFKSVSRTLLGVTVIFALFMAPANSGILGDIIDTVGKISKKAYSRAADAAKEAAAKATTTADQAVKGDYDAVADSVIAAASNPAPFRDAVLDKLVEVTPDQFKGVVDKGTDLYKNLDNQYSEIKAGTYRNLYDTYKGDILEIAKRVQNGDFDVSEYLKYSLWYGIATADWKNDPKGSAVNIGTNQYRAYAWYKSHTVQGAAYKATMDHIGLSNKDIAEGIIKLKDELKDQKLGVFSLAILTEFSKAARKNYIGPGEYLEQNGCIISENGKYSVVFQGDANLVYKGKCIVGLLDHHRNGSFAEYQRNGNHCTCVQQNDGNLVVYGFQGNKPVGATMAGGKAKGNYFTVVQDDGNVVTYPGTSPSDCRGPAIWNSGTQE